MPAITFRTIFGSMDAWDSLHPCSPIDGKYKAALDAGYDGEPLPAWHGDDPDVLANWRDGQEEALCDAASFGSPLESAKRWCGAMG